LAAWIRENIWGICVLAIPRINNKFAGSPDASLKNFPVKIDIDIIEIPGF
jgi:hypothetical protein